MLRKPNHAGGARVEDPGGNLGRFEGRFAKDAESVGEFAASGCKLPYCVYIIIWRAPAGVLQVQQAQNSVQAAGQIAGRTHTGSGQRGCCRSYG